VVSQLHSTRHLQTMSLCLFAKLILPDPNSCAFFEIFTHDTILFQLTLYHGQNHETIEKQRKNPETLIYQGFGIWWSGLTQIRTMFALWVDFYCAVDSMMYKLF